VDRVHAESDLSESRIVRSGSVVEDEDELLYGESAPSLFSAAIVSEIPSSSSGDKNQASFMCLLFRTFMSSGYNVM